LWNEKGGMEVLDEVPNVIEKLECWIKFFK
jgi:hypothetical protein